MKTILVTGGAGFIGSNLCDKLLEIGYEAINIDNFNDYYNPKIKEANIKNALKNKNYKLYRGDILDNDLLDKIFEENKIDLVIHLAAMAGVRNSLKNPCEYIDIDIKGSVNLLQKCVKYKITKFIAASSSSVYGINEKIPFSEDDATEKQVSPYAVAKKSMELFCSTYSSIYDISIACLRFFTVYGPRQRPEMAIHTFVKSVLEGMPINVYGDGRSKRDYTYIDDIIDGIVSLIDNKFKFEIFNLGSNKVVELRELIEIIENTTGKKAIINSMSVQNGDVPLTFADIKKSKEKLNFYPKTQIEEGLKKFYQWYKLNNVNNI